MEHEGLEIVGAVAQKKLNFLRYKARYFVYAMMAGAFCSLGMALAYSAGAGVYYSEAISGLYKVALGLAFPLSFTLIVFSGSELFTGNVMVMTIGTLQKRCSAAQALGLLAYCYIANLIGAALMGALVAGSGILNGQSGELLVMATEVKMTLPFSQGLMRGVLCNLLVSLGSWTYMKMKSESAKLIVLFWVIFGFVTPGYEHSVANAGVFVMAAMSPFKTEVISLAGVVRNLVPVTLGNLLGGSVLVGLVYWFAGRKLDEPKEAKAKKVKASATQRAL